MSFAVKIEELDTGEVCITFFNQSESWEKLFHSVSLAAKEAERLGVFDSATRRRFEQVMDSGDCGYLDQHVAVRVNQLLSLGFQKQP